MVRAASLLFTGAILARELPNSVGQHTQVQVTGNRDEYPNADTKAQSNIENLAENWHLLYMLFRLVPGSGDLWRM